MANPVLADRAHTRLSRLTGEGRDVRHISPSVGPFSPLPGPGDAVEVFRGSLDQGFLQLFHSIRKSSRSNHVKWQDPVHSRAGTMTIYTGPNYLRFGDIGNVRSLLRKIDRYSRNRRKTLLILRDTVDSPLAHMFDQGSVYDFKGYLDWGITYGTGASKLRATGLVSDVGGFWSSDRKIGTILVPGTATLGGVLRGRTVMRKADIMVSTNPPYEYVQRVEGSYTKEEVTNSKLVSEARKIWNPDTHYFTGTHEDRGILLGYGDKRMLTLNGRRDGAVVRWSSGDLEKGPIDGPGGYPINMKYYIPT